MKLVDVVTQLRLLLPRETGLFSKALSITSISAVGGVATISASSHGLTSGDAVTISGVQTQTAISAVTKSGNVFTFTTLTAHDLTFGWKEHKNVVLTGFTDPAWNGSFLLASVPNRTTFTLQSANNLPVLNTAEKLLETRSDGVNGQRSVTVTGPGTFTVSGSFLDGNYLGGSINSLVRVVGAVSAERAIEIYTKQKISDLWMFVVMHDGEVSRDRRTDSDALSVISVGDTLRMKLIDGFSLYIVKSTTTDIAAVAAVDLCRHTLLQPVLKALYGAKFDHGLSTGGNFRTIFKGHGLSQYDRSLYVHTYEFETVADLTDGDAVPVGDTRAFRDIDYTHSFGTSDTTDMTLKPINLDETP